MDQITKLRTLPKYEFETLPDVGTKYYMIETDWIDIDDDRGYHCPSIVETVVIGYEIRKVYSHTGHQVGEEVYRLELKRGDEVFWKHIRTDLGSLDKAKVEGLLAERFERELHYAQADLMEATTKIEFYSRKIKEAKGGR